MVTKTSTAPTSVSPTGRVTFTGRLLQEAPGWKPYAHQTVLVVYRKPGRGGPGGRGPPARRWAA